MTSLRTNNYFWRTHRQQQLLVAAALVLLLMVCSNRAEAAAADAGEDFAGYMEDVQRQEQEERLYQDMLRRHEIWLQTTWSGFVVTQIQAIGKQFAPFILAILEALDETSDPDSTKGPSEVAAYLGIRMAFVIIILMVVHALAKIAQLVIGTNYEVVEEIVILHEHDTEEEANRARTATTRGKKQKAS